jgi:hypothetical protein
VDVGVGFVDRAADFATKAIWKTSYRHKINGVMRRYFGKQMTRRRKLKIRSDTDKAALKFGSAVWVLKETQEQRQQHK